MNPEKKEGEILCPNCAKPIKKDAVFCTYCGVQIKELKVSAETIALTPEQELEEGKKQLGGIVILLWVLIGLLSFAFLLALFASCATMFEEDFYSGFSLLVLYFFFYGGILVLFIFAQLGIKNQKRYAVPLVRIILVLGCFSLVGLIMVLITFWKRINNQYSKKYLNYFDGTY